MKSLVSKKKNNKPAGISDKQWRGKSDLDKLREKYREREVGEARSRMADTSACVRERHLSHEDGETVDGIERIKVNSITMADMSKREILKMNEELYQLSDRARDPFSARSNRRREGLYFDALGRRRYRSPERSSRDRDRNG